MTTRYVTSDGLPPNGGVPPGWDLPLNDGPPAPPVQHTPQVVVFQPPATQPTPQAAPQTVMVLPVPAASPSPPPPPPSYTAAPVPHYPLPMMPAIAPMAPAFVPYTPPQPLAVAPAPAPQHNPPPRQPTPPPSPPRGGRPFLAEPSDPPLPEMLSNPLTTIHLVKRNVTPLPCSSRWNPRDPIHFTKHTAPPELKVGDLIRKIRPHGDPGREHGIIQIEEQGNGRWTRGLQVRLRDRNADSTLAEVGWGGFTEGQRDAIWLCFAEAN